MVHGVDFFSGTKILLRLLISLHSKSYKFKTGGFYWFPYPLAYGDLNLRVLHLFSEYLESTCTSWHSGYIGEVQHEGDRDMETMWAICQGLDLEKDYDS